MSQKAKSLLIIVVFVALIILPVCYALVKEKMLSQKTEKAVPKP